jgi:Ca2+-binding RTX toxin-like protein
VVPLALAWSPDGRRLAWASASGLTVAAEDGSDVHTVPDLAAQTVAWSPDGTKLAVAATEPPCETRSGVFVVDAETLAARRLTNDCRIAGTPGDDRISAGAFEDVVSGGAGNDAIDGGTWADRLDGGPGDDAIEGGGGADTLTGGPGRDRISGGAGRDTILARDGEPDTVRCGSEYDIAIVDPADTVARDCEGVLRTARDRYIDAGFGGGRAVGGPGDDVIVGGREKARGPAILARWTRSPASCSSRHRRSTTRTSGAPSC